MTVMNGNKSAAIYARVSTEDQGKGCSIPTQIEACQKLAREQGYTVSDRHILIDDGVSGVTLDRPARRALRDVLPSGAIAAVIVLEPDRLARKTGKLLVLKNEMDEAGVKLLCVSHPIDDGAEGSLFFQMRGVLAEYEREKLLERTRRGLLVTMKRVALEALDIEVRWTPGEALQITGRIPLEDDVSSTPLAHSTPPISEFTCGGSASRP